MLVGSRRVSRDNDRQMTDLQRDALLDAGSIPYSSFWRRCPRIDADLILRQQKDAQAPAADRHGPEAAIAVPVISPHTWHLCCIASTQSHLQPVHHGSICNASFWT